MLEIVSSDRIRNKAIVTKNISEIENYLLSIFNKESSDIFIKFLEDQQNDSNKFPNCIIFLDDTNNSITINQFMKEIK